VITVTIDGWLDWEIDAQDVNTALERATDLP
jgi:hypothetical protein